MKFAIKYMLVVIGAILLIGIVTNLWLVGTNNCKMTADLDQVEPAFVGLVLGTSSSPDGVNINTYFEERMEAAIRLYESGKVKHLLVSGDNSSIHYNEPRDMRNYLVNRGIPAQHITLDYAGFRTYDSILRSKEIFGLDEFIIVTQSFHAPRALYIAEKTGIRASAYVANDPPQGISNNIIAREWMARIVAVMDILTNRQPKFYGNQEYIHRDDV
ncbi:MAG: SanA protein [Saprospirales bacterium]|jgi:SanA protein|nr:MAG: SanA protein [Saprospirales bacterium]